MELTGLRKKRDDKVANPLCSEHSFSHRQKRSSRRWNPSIRSVATIVPDGIANDLQNRDLDENDYELLLQLDKPSVQGSIPLHIVSTFPTTQLKRGHSLLAGGGQRCTVCADTFKPMELARSIPCGHSFHQQCIDRWLIQQRATCPTCGTAAYLSLDNSAEDDGPRDVANYIRTLPDPMKPKKSGGRRKKNSGSRKVQSSEKEKISSPRDMVPPGAMAVFGTRQIGLPRIGLSGSLVGKSNEFPLSNTLDVPPPSFQMRETESRAQRNIVISPLPILPPLRKSLGSFHEGSHRFRMGKTGEARELGGGGEPLSFSDLLVTNHHAALAPIAPAEAGSVYIDPEIMSNFSGAFGRSRGETDSTSGRLLYPSFSPLRKSKVSKQRGMQSKESPNNDTQPGPSNKMRFDSMIMGFGLRSNSTLFTPPR
ncbi:E3 ubiquitin-protein ligase Zswim2 [Dinochytrium kinnereticum]|nr:E3 ubiquitin-protein ligase Zswim2 [Dinochytrium kinnereticum]